VTTATEQAEAATAHVGDELGLVRTALLAFGGIALFVGSFIIFNTLSITVAQRTRELATLRVLGASRRQVFASIVTEGAIVGAVASLLGLVAGIGFAAALDALFAAGGIDLPAAATVVSGRTILVSLAAGVGVTLAASIVPARRAMRVEPAVAIREGSSNPLTDRPAGRHTAIATVAVLGVGVAGLVPALVLTDLSPTVRLALLAAGALVVFIAVALAARWAIPALATAIEKPLEPLTGATGELARSNIVRNPGRTATTATALTVGVALIAFVTIVAQGLRDSTANSIRDQISADYVITHDQDRSPPRCTRPSAPPGSPAPACGPAPSTSSAPTRP